MIGFIASLSIVVFFMLFKITTATEKSKKGRQRLTSKKIQRSPKSFMESKFDSTTQWQSIVEQRDSIIRSNSTPTASWQKTDQEKNSVLLQHEHYSDDQDEIKWTKDFLAKLEWKLFEDICVEYLRSKHCNANVTCTGADGGVDIKVQDPAGRVIAIGQCKAWNKPIGVSLIRELYGIMAAERIKHGIFLTSSFFSKDAKQFAKDKDLLLIDGVELAALISQLDADEKACIQARVVKADYSTHNLCTL